MPPLPDYPNVLRVAHLFRVGDDLSVRTTWHFTYTGTAPSNATCDTIAADILAAAVTNLLPVIDASNALLGVEVTDLSTPTSGAGEALGTHVGTRSTGPLPASTCMLLNQPISRRYRGGKPRTYWPFGGADDLTSPQLWLGSAVTDFTFAIQAQLDSIFAISSGGTAIASWCSISYYEGFTAVTNPITGRTRDVPKVRTAAIAPDLISTFVVNPRPGTQRRRVAA